MEIINNTDTYHTSIQTSFPLDPYINFDSSISKFDESRMIMDITERIDIYKYIEYPNPKTVREYDDLIMLRIVLLAYTLFGFASLREMEKLCRYDIRFMFVSNFAQPSHETIMRFMNRMRRDNGFSGNIHDMFVDIMKVIEEDTDVA